jgi:hypothetical protein
MNSTLFTTTPFTNISNLCLPGKCLRVVKSRKWIEGIRRLAAVKTPELLLAKPVW